MSANKKKSGGRPPAIVSEQRKQKAIELAGKGKSQVQIAQELGVSQVAICKSLKELRRTMSAATARDFEVYRKGQLAILESIEDALLENKVAPDVAREWRAIRSDIARLLGLNAPDRSVSVNVATPADSGLTVEFLRRAHGLSDADMNKVFAFMETLPKQKPVIDASYFPEDEKQLGDGSER